MNLHRLLLVLTFAWTSKAAATDGEPNSTKAPGHPPRVHNRNPLAIAAAIIPMVPWAIEQGKQWFKSRDETIREQERQRLLAAEHGVVPKVPEVPVGVPKPVATEPPKWIAPGLSSHQQQGPAQAPPPPPVPAHAQIHHQPAPEPKPPEDFELRSLNASNDSTAIWIASTLLGVVFLAICAVVGGVCCYCCIWRDSPNEDADRSRKKRRSQSGSRRSSRSRSRSSRSSSAGSRISPGGSSSSRRSRQSRNSSRL